MTVKEQIIAGLNSLNKPQSSTVRQAVGEEIERLMLDYLEENEQDLEIWFKLVLLEFWVFHDEDASIKYLWKIWAIHNDIRAVVMIAYMQDDYMGGVEDDVNQILINSVSPDLVLQACIVMYRGLYYRLKEDIKMEPLLWESVALYPKLVHSYFYLGHYYKGTGNKVKALECYRKAIESVEHVHTTTESSEQIDEPDSFDVQEYFNEMIIGTSVSRPKLEILQECFEKVLY